jgi:predicted acyltransferase
MTDEKPKRRLLSLDLFRGATIASMILVNNPGGDVSYAPLEHATWHGWTFTDTVFPFFLWIVGVAMTLSTARRMERGESRALLVRHAVQRAVIIFLLGFLLGPFPNIDFASIRIPGVLQRIAVCYLAATLIFLFTRVRGQILWAVGLNVLYWGLMMLYPVPGCGAGSLAKDCNFARYIDGLALSGHMWKASRVWDPEGIVSTLPAISTVLAGILAGHLLRAVAEHAKRVRRLLLGGAGLALLGLLLSLWMPINKNLWTTSFAAFMSGLAAVVFAAWYWLADIRGWGRWFRPFEIFGTNAILMFLLSGSFAKFMAMVKLGDGTSLHGWLYGKVLLAVASPINASLLYALCNVAVLFLVAWFLYRRRWFLKF